ncbi:hypothetical protein BRM9_1680 [Methanobacterium formicicum]|uniref:Uncharacterized protein n=1 Tax=Methanobacterium formicicum TaxID=2162 RepID=A0A089ZCH5_METFO|nr:hypothetical protein [Methanobacterium formicicum]AIS32491.1 hypothetical protein BRM9_1680 [Methanobacterium formicicum]
MAAGDFITVDGTIANNATIDIKPSADLEVWNLKELMVSGAFILYANTNGTQIEKKSYPQGEHLNLTKSGGYQVHKTSFYQFKNISGGSLNYSFKYGVLK